MFPLERNLVSLYGATIPDPAHENMLRDPVRPIVLLPKRPGSCLAPEIAPNMGETNVIGMNLLSRLASWRVEGTTIVLVPTHPQAKAVS